MRERPAGSRRFGSPVSTFLSAPALERREPFERRFRAVRAVAARRRNSRCGKGRHSREHRASRDRPCRVMPVCPASIAPSPIAGVRDSDLSGERPLRPTVVEPARPACPQRTSAGRRPRCGRSGRGCRSWSPPDDRLPSVARSMRCSRRSRRRRRSRTVPICGTFRCPRRPRRTRSRLRRGRLPSGACSGRPTALVVEADVRVEPRSRGDPAVLRADERAGRLSRFGSMRASEPTIAYGPTETPGATRAAFSTIAVGWTPGRADRRGNALARIAARAAEGSETSMTVRPGNGPADRENHPGGRSDRCRLGGRESATKERSRGPALSSDLTPSTTKDSSPTRRPPQTEASSATGAAAGSLAIRLLLLRSRGRRRRGRLGVGLRGCRDRGVELLDHGVGNVDARVRVEQAALELVEDEAVAQLLRDRLDDREDPALELAELLALELLELALGVVLEALEVQRLGLVVLLDLLLASSESDLPWSWIFFSRSRRSVWRFTRSSCLADWIFWIRARLSLPTADSWTMRWTSMTPTFWAVAGRASRAAAATAPATINRFPIIYVTPFS